MLVMKFGGSSVADQQQVDKVLAIVRGRLARRPVVVSSAHKGITDALINAARAASRGTLSAEDVIARQRGVASALGCDDGLLEPFYQEIRALLHGISLVKELSPRSVDYISSFGERMAVRAIADYFCRRGLNAKAYDVWDLGFITDSNFGAARPLPGFPDRVQRAFKELVPDDVIPVITGFIGKNPEDEITTVGRNGSDLTASLLAAALAAEEVEIWTDTDGVMTADPSLVPEARNIPTMRFDEASELAYFGGRVLHPSTLVPAMEQGIPVRVLNTNRPDHPGTVITEHASNPLQVTSIAYKEQQYVLTVSSTRMFGASGYLAEVFDILRRHSVVVDVIATSEVSLSVTSDARSKLEAALPELRRFGDCVIEEKKTILAVVGQHLPERPGLGSEILRAVAEAGVNVRMVSYGMSSINFAMLIDDADIRRAVPRLHDRLFGGA